MLASLCCRRDVECPTHSAGSPGGKSDAFRCRGCSGEGRAAAGRLERQQYRHPHPAPWRWQRRDGGVREHPAPQRQLERRCRRERCCRRYGVMDLSTSVPSVTTLLSNEAFRDSQTCTDCAGDLQSRALLQNPVLIAGEQPLHHLSSGHGSGGIRNCMHVQGRMAADTPSGWRHRRDRGCPPRSRRTSSQCPPR